MLLPDYAGELMRDVFCGDATSGDAISVWLMTKSRRRPNVCWNPKLKIPNFALRSVDDLRNRRRLADEVAEDDDASWRVCP